MKKIFTFFTAAMLSVCMFAETYSVTYNLTGCEVDGDAPTTVTDDDDQLSIDLVALTGYTDAGATVTVTMDGEELSTDYMEDNWFMFMSGNVFIYCLDNFSGDVVITAEYPEAPEIVLPETFSAATFEEATYAMEANNVYRPESFKVGDNWLISGAVAVDSKVEDWTMYGAGYGYSGTQIVNYASDATIANGSDRYLPMAASVVAQGNNYATVNIMGAFEQFKLTKTTLSGLAITNTAFNVDAFLNGDGMSTNPGEKKGAPFGQGDYFVLHITGLNGESVTGTVDYYLADFRTAGDWKFAENWQWVNLSTLGEIDGLQFELEGTKYNSYGMTTATYFCVDNIGGAAADCTLGAMTSLYELKLTEGYASMCWDKNWTVEGAKVYTAQYNASANLIDLYEVNGTIPAGSGVIVYAEGKEKVLLRQSHDEAAPLAYNSLVGVNEETAVSSLGLNNIYALGLANSAVAFCKYTGSNVPAHRAVLGLPTAASNVRMRIVNTTTDLENVENVRAIKHIENGQLIIERDGVRYNVMGIQF